MYDKYYVYTGSDKRTKSYPTNLRRLRKGTKRGNGGAIILVRCEENGNVVAVGVSMCSRSDQFDFARGITLAHERLEAAMKQECGDTFAFIAPSVPKNHHIFSIINNIVNR